MYARAIIVNRMCTRAHKATRARAHDVNATPSVAVKFYIRPSVCVCVYDSAINGTHLRGVNIDFPRVATAERACIFLRARALAHTQLDSQVRETCDDDAVDDDDGVSVYVCVFCVHKENIIYIGYIGEDERALEHAR